MHQRESQSGLYCPLILGSPSLFTHNPWRRIHNQHHRQPTRLRHRSCSSPDEKVDVLPCLLFFSQKRKSTCSHRGYLDQRTSPLSGSTAGVCPSLQRRVLSSSFRFSLLLSFYPASHPWRCNDQVWFMIAFSFFTYWHSYMFFVGIYFHLSSHSEHTCIT